MSKQRKPNRNRTNKAAPSFPKGSGGQTRNVAPLVQALTQNQQATTSLSNPNAPLEWMAALFGPGLPIPTESLDPRRPDTNQADPRIWQYPVAWNLDIGNDRHRLVPWRVLREAADQPLFRSCIEIRKSEIASLDWTVAITDEAVEAEALQANDSAKRVESELRKKYADDIARIRSFFAVPDRQNGYTFADWIKLFLEEHFVLDAIAIYPRKTYGGDLAGLEILDGQHIKPLLDERGARPLPPAPAYQQVLYGFPRGDFVADTVDVDGNPVIDGALAADQLIYRRHTHRVWTPYGFSPTEQALLDGYLYMKRFRWMIAEYTEGSMPAQFMETGDTTNWSPRQLLEYERAFNDRYAGSMEERMKFPFLPPGMTPHQMSQVGERYKPDFDLHLVKLVASHFAVTVTELGFTETGALGSSFHEGQEDVQYRKATLPTAKWVAGILTDIARAHLDMPDELEFKFLGLENQDEAAADSVAKDRLSRGVLTINEDRARLGLPAFSFDEADKPLWGTQRGVVFLEGASETADPGVLVQPASEPNVLNGMQGGQAPGQPPTGGEAVPPGKTSPAAPGKPPANAGPKPPPKQDTNKVADEIAAFRRWVKKNPSSARPFNFSIPKADVPDDIAASHQARFGDDDPKA